MSATGTAWGYACVILFVLSYAFVVLEERLNLRKSVPALLGAAGAWTLVGILFALRGESLAAEAAFRSNLLDYAELLLFLLVAMTFVNTLEERQVFAAVRAGLIGRGFTLRQIFWITGAMAFVISPIADNLTTALIMSSVSLAVGRDRPEFVVVACINVVVAANAGGAFSPFGDITTLMAWQQGVLPFTRFFALLIPSLVNWLVPAAIMSFSIRGERPRRVAEPVVLKAGGLVIVAVLLGTIGFTVAMHSALRLPPVFGMMTGLGFLKLYGHLLHRSMVRNPTSSSGVSEVIDHLDDQTSEAAMSGRGSPPGPADEGFDVSLQLARADWDTVLFFYGIMLSVGALGTLGYLVFASHALYSSLGPTLANVFVGVASAVIDNIPIMFAVVTMHPVMSDGQWLLVTLTAGVGGSLLSVGSAAGVALMGLVPRGLYIRRHLRWTWAIALGYVASIGAHLLVNHRYF